MRKTVITCDGCKKIVAEFNAADVAVSKEGRITCMNCFVMEPNIVSLESNIVSLKGGIWPEYSKQ